MAKYTVEEKLQAGKRGSYDIANSIGQKIRQYLVAK